MALKKKKAEQFYASLSIVLMAGLKHSIRETTDDSSQGGENTRISQTCSFRLTLGVATWHFYTDFVFQTENSPLNIA